MQPINGINPLKTYEPRTDATPTNLNRLDIKIYTKNRRHNLSLDGLVAEFLSFSTFH